MPSQGFKEGTGTPKTITLANPAAGSEISQTVPTDKAWRVYLARIPLTTAVAAADRTPQLRITDGTNILWESRTHDNHIASLTRTYNWDRDGEYSTTVDVDEFYNILIDLGILLAGDIISTITGNLQGADDWGAGFLRVEEFSIA